MEIARYRKENKRVCDGIEFMEGKCDALDKEVKKIGNDTTSMVMIGKKNCMTG